MTNTHFYQILTLSAKFDRTPSKETAGGDDGELPANRGALLQCFVRSERLLRRAQWPDQEMRVCAERSLEQLAWAMQKTGGLIIDSDGLYGALETARGHEGYALPAMRARLQETGLLVGIGDGRYRLLHQMVQEYGAAAYLVRQGDCAHQLPRLARATWNREVCIMALWLRAELQTPDYLLGLMSDPEIDLRVRVVAGEILAQIGDPRLQRNRDGSVEAIEPEMVVIPEGMAILGGEDPEAFDDELP